ncbi:MAG TPA: autotransporter-associated beta strand repeat-containing protein, partial [Xanthobacteraceae bacterium]|nr:autotransporter-associated beta strand repeat-containing protein [Xanthobacteraceae bacterium]
MFALTMLALSGRAHAQDAVWLTNPVDSEYSNPLNWSTGAVPTGVGVFDSSNVTTITIGQPVNINTILVYSAFTFNVTTGTTGAVNIVGPGNGDQSSGVPNGGIAGADTINLVTPGTVVNLYSTGLNGGTTNVTAAQTELHLYGRSFVTTLNVANGGSVTFHDRSNPAGNISVGSNGKVTFLDNTATNSNLTISGNGVVEFNTTGGGIFVTFSGSNGLIKIYQSTFFGRLEGAGTVDLIAGDLLIIRRNMISNFSGVIQGAGSITIDNHHLVLTGTNTYTGPTTLRTSNAILTLGDGGTTGSVAGNIVNTGQVRLNRSDDYNFSNLISGTGQLIHNGTGNTTLTANNTYTGLTTINAGTLTIQGSITSSSEVIVNNNATLAGTGYVPGVTINTGGVLSPGTTAGTLHVSGNLTFQPGSVLAIHVAPTTSTRVDITGTAALNGSVQVTGANVSYGSARTTTILSATGGVTGTFTGVTS